VPDISYVALAAVGLPACIAAAFKYLTIRYVLKDVPAARRAEILRSLGGLFGGSSQSRV
jgi:hypothetical protein